MVSDAYTNVLKNWSMALISKMCPDFLSCSQSRGSLRARDCHSIQTLDLGSLPSISELYVTALPRFKSTNNSTCCMLTSSQTIQMPMDPHGICVLVSECSCL